MSNLASMIAQTANKPRDCLTNLPTTLYCGHLCLATFHSNSKSVQSSSHVRNVPKKQTLVENSCDSTMDCGFEVEQELTGKTFCLVP